MENKWNKAYLSLGSNLGDRLGNIQSAVGELKKSEKIRILRCSKVYETEPVGNFTQPMFYNIIIEVETELTPLELLKETQKIEYLLGRDRRERWGPRVIDIDIILYDDIVWVSEELKIPHPEYTTRRFVLVPLLEVCKDLADPVTGRKILEVLQDSKLVGDVHETNLKIIT
ncbi:MAG: 2-amino-4-hydroxy-6-hydroxymethyldihydropteridine diphosphokinase [Candidatus Hydrogenedentes bacterium]|nr:2-amino-4-hydroxy-6-hydroxymethyldihydropteridine diphosphokinase [Candidatus Hydrogenedentota bacterium]